MSDEKILVKHPVSVNLEAGKTYAWCRCGLTQAKPLCDGSHKSTELRPLIWKAAQSGEVWLCQCQRTKNQPYCDGTHKTL